MVILALIQSFVLVSLYHGTGDVELTKENLIHYDENLTNWLGLVFLATSD